jgi:hypothetical protein
MSLSKNKVCLKWTKTSKKCDGGENYFVSGVPKMVPAVAASLG